MKVFVSEAVGGAATDRAVQRVRSRGSVQGNGALALPVPANRNVSRESGGKTPARRGGWYRSHGKRLFDLVVVAAVAPVAVPVLCLAILVLLIEGGKPFFVQERLGKGGRIFRMWKLRTMVPDAETKLQFYLDSDSEMNREWEATQKLKNDPRVTRVGAFMRRTSIDELPQLWNVLKGDMSVVGPRPMMPDQLRYYGDASAYLAQLPGITGPWQVGIRNDSDFAHRASLDAAYLRSASFAEDMRYVLRTVGVVIRATGC